MHLYLWKKKKDENIYHLGKFKILQFRFNPKSGRKIIWYFFGKKESWSIKWNALLKKDKRYWLFRIFDRHKENHGFYSFNKKEKNVNCLLKETCVII